MNKLLLVGLLAMSSLSYAEGRNDRLTRTVLKTTMEQSINRGGELVKGTVRADAKIDRGLVQVIARKIDKGVITKINKFKVTENTTEIKGRYLRKLDGELVFFHVKPTKK